MSERKNTPRPDATFIAVDPAKIRVGMLVHARWAKRGCVWRVKKYDPRTGIVEAETVKTRKPITLDAVDLVNVRQVEHG